MKTINIAKEYSDTPLGRYRGDGEFSGERFREEFLLPALKNDDSVRVEIDGVEGYGSSFLEEAFGGLVRKGHFTAKALKSKLEVVLSDKNFRVYATLIWKYIAEAKSRSEVQ